MLNPTEIQVKTDEKTTQAEQIRCEKHREVLASSATYEVKASNLDFPDASEKTPKITNDIKAQVEPCGCLSPECVECSQYLADQEEDAMMADVCHHLNQQEERTIQNQGEDTDDYDEEDTHGSHPIDDPNVEEEEEEEEEIVDADRKLTK
jgi:hypothetical protein